MKFREILRILEEDGWRIVRTTGSHRIMKHPAKRGVVVVAGHPNVDAAPGTLRSIWKQAGLENRQ